jgi:hypothetical protein
LPAYVKINYSKIVYFIYSVGLLKVLSNLVAIPFLGEQRTIKSS